MQRLAGPLKLARSVLTSRGVSTATALQELRGKDDDIDKYLYLRELQRLQEGQFYSLLIQHTEEVLPYVYTPTVGEACQRYHHLPLVPKGLYLRATESERFLDILRAWPQQDVRVVVVTDGERVLGLGDLGTGGMGIYLMGCCACLNRVVVVTDGERVLGLGDLGTGGMGIVEGKILLYTAAAGVSPRLCLPVCLDVGTNNAGLLGDPVYKGLRQRRLTGEAYDGVVGAFMGALRAWRPHVLVQFEDFANHAAFDLLRRYRGSHCAFNDDIQGTATITLAGLLSAQRATGGTLAEQRVLFYGAGEAGTGIAELIAIALQRRHGLTLEQGRQRCLFMDSKGLVCASRTDLQPHKVPFAHDLPFQRSLLDAVHAFKPTALVGVSTVRGAFSADVLQAMAEQNERPIIFPLSNPTSKAECTHEEAFRATQGSALFASGSPFPPITSPSGATHHAAQANNAYVFPAVGFAAVLTRARAISDEVFLTAAEALSQMTTLQELDRGLLFPRFSRIQAVSASLTAEVAQGMVRSGLGTQPEDFDAVVSRLPQTPEGNLWREYVLAKMYKTPLESKL